MFLFPDHINWKTLKLTIKKVSIQDTGLYLCRSARYAEFEAPYVSVIVKKGKLLAGTAFFQHLFSVILLFYIALLPIEPGELT